MSSDGDARQSKPQPHVLTSVPASSLAFAPAAVLDAGTRGRVEEFGKRMRAEHALRSELAKVLADCGFTCDCREKIQTEFDIVFSDEEVNRLRVICEFPDHQKNNQNGIGWKASAENKVRFTYDASPFMPAVLGGGSRLQFEISKNGGETWDAAGQFMSSSANVLVSASFPSAVSSDWQIRVVLIGCGPLAAVDLVPKDESKAASGVFSMTSDSGRRYSDGKMQLAARRMQI